MQLLAPSLNLVQVAVLLVRRGRRTLLLLTLNRQHGHLPRRFKSVQVLQRLPIFNHQLWILRHRYRSPRALQIQGHRFRSPRVLSHQLQILGLQFRSPQVLSRQRQILGRQFRSPQVLSHRRQILERRIRSPQEPQPRLMFSHQLRIPGHQFRSVPVSLLLLRYRIASYVPLSVTTFPGARSSVPTLTLYGLRQWSVGSWTGVDCGGVLPTTRLKKTRMEKSANS